MPVCLIASILGKDQTLVSHYLKMLKEYKLVEEKSIGKFKYYLANKDKARNILKMLTKKLT